MINLEGWKGTLSGPHLPVPTFPLSTPPKKQQCAILRGGGRRGWGVEGGGGGGEGEKEDDDDTWNKLHKENSGISRAKSLNITYHKHKGNIL